MGGRRNAVPDPGDPAQLLRSSGQDRVLHRYGCPYVNLTFEAWTGTGAGSYNGSANSTTLILNGPVNETASYGLNGYCYWADTPAFYSTCASSGLTVSFHESGLPSGVRWGVSVWGPGPNQTTPFPAYTDGEHPQRGRSRRSRGSPTSRRTPSRRTSPERSGRRPRIRALRCSGLSMGRRRCTYTLNPVTSIPLTSSITAVGLPTGTSWSFSEDGLETGTSSASTNLSWLGGSHQLTANPVYLHRRGRIRRDRD